MMEPVAVDNGKQFSDLVPYGGWLLALFLLIWMLKQFAGSFLQKMGTDFAAASVRIFGSRSLKGRVLDAYSRSIKRNYGEHALGFRREGTVEVRQVFVPLKYIDEDGHRQDVIDFITDEERVVVLGEPGAGKSLLSKNLLMTWAVNPAKATKPIPVLVELHRCNSLEVSLVELITAELERNGVPRRDGLVERALGEGKFLVLFDGLDEVAQESQTRVINAVRDFCQQWAACSYITTCRIAVYTGQLSPVFKTTVTIADFDDAGIRQLLAKWPGLDGPEADRFFAGLANTPQLMRLAGSPLLLTMMVYLHTEVFAKTGRNLPGSRPAFYEVAVDHLLSRDRELARDEALSIYEGADKRAALQRIALSLQLAPPERPDRRSIDRLELIRTVKDVGTSLNLRDKDVQPLLREIVERSQLLVELDGQASRYVFRHLTLQEFLTACELRNDSERLMQSFRVDPDGWRETVRLWCGVTNLNFTQVVRELFEDERSSVLALQCVAEATNIDPGFADEVIEHFLGMVATGSSSRAIESALAAVSSDDRPRGRGVFERLAGMFQSAGGRQRVTLGQVLAATRLPAAAEVLGQFRTVDEHIRASLRSMGEQAVPVLRAAASGHEIGAVDDLGEIATVSAAAALGSLVWDESPISFRAAWWLAGLIGRPEIEDGLELALLRPPQSEDYFEWVWRPFAEPQHAALRTLMGRVAWLLGRDEVGLVSPSLSEIDHRLGMAVAVLDEADGIHQNLTSQARSESPRTLSHAPRTAYVNAYDRTSEEVAADGYPVPDTHGRSLYGHELIFFAREYPQWAERYVGILLDELGMPAHRQRVFLRMRMEIQYVLISRSFFDSWGRCSVAAWVDATSPIRGLRLVTTLLTVSLWVFGVLAVGATAYRVLPWWHETPDDPRWATLLGQLSLVAAALSALLFLVIEVSPSKQPFATLSDWADEAIAYVVFAFLITIPIDVANLVVTINDAFGPWVAGGFTGAALTLLTCLATSVKRRSGRARNPFRPYLSATGPQLVREVLPRFGGYTPTRLPV